MKFACERCGKKYATAGDPAPGKVYKLKCKACGHLIVVKGQAGTAPGTPALAGPTGAAATPPQAPPLAPPAATTLRIELPAETEPHAAPSSISPPDVAGPSPAPASSTALEAPPPAVAVEPGPLPPEVALAVDSAAGPAGTESAEPPPGPLDRPGEAPPGQDPALTPPPPEKDELADFAAAAAEVMAGVGGPGQDGGPGDVEPFGAGAAGRPATDPFSVAARASLPDTWTGGTPASAPPAPSPVPPAPAPARATPRRSALRGPPIVIIGLGLVALIGITAFALLGRGGSPPPASPVAAPAPVTGPPPPEPGPPAQEPGPPVQEPSAARPAEPEPEPRAPERKPEPRARPPERRQEKRPEAKPAERKAEPARPPAPDAAALGAESRDADQPEATGLPRDEVNKVVQANRKAFSACIANAAGSEVKLDGRPVALRITINTNGTVTYPTLDEQALNSTEMGQCLKSAARLMIFPKFKGDPFQHDVVLALSGN
jgi:hypothetical protein